MIAVDTNILVYAHRTDSPFFKQAEKTIIDVVNAGTTWAIPWPCLHEFFGIITHPRIYKMPTPRTMALAQIENLVSCPTLEIISETPDHWPVFKKLISVGSIDGPRVHDAKIAAICLENAVSKLLSCDRDFSRFKELKTLNPL
jgi:toxin-antitoxin system PIN domain toxin